MRSDMRPSFQRWMKTTGSSVYFEAAMGAATEAAESSFVLSVAVLSLEFCALRGEFDMACHRILLECRVVNGKRKK